MSINNFLTNVDFDIDLSSAQRTHLGMTEDDNYTVNTVRTDLRWSLELDMRGYGVRDVVVTVPSQVIEISITVWGDEDIEKTLEIAVQDVGVEVSDGFPSVPRLLTLSDDDFTLHF